MLLSFVVPIYNAEKYLKDCLESLLTQKPSFEYEILLVDDGSKDKSASICDEYASKYNFIKVFHKKNEGQLLTRLYGVNHAKGDYILFLDADDYHSEGSLETIYNLLKKSNYPDVLMFNFNVKLRRKLYYHNLFDELKQNPTSVSLAKRLLIENVLNALWNKCYKRELLLSTLKDIKEMDSRTEEDLYMGLLIFDKCQSFYYEDVVLYTYRQVPTSITLKPVTSDTLKDKINPYMLKILLECSKKWGFYSEETVKKVYTKKYESVYNLVNNSYIYHGFKKTEQLIKKNDLFSYICEDAKDKIDYAKDRQDLYTFLVYLKDNKLEEIKKYLKAHSLKERIKAIIKKCLGML